jgi:hypothetical protein
MIVTTTLIIIFGTKKMLKESMLASRFTTNKTFLTITWTNLKAVGSSFSFMHTYMENNKIK